MERELKDKSEHRTNSDFWTPEEIRKHGVTPQDIEMSKERKRIKTPRHK